MQLFNRKQKRSVEERSEAPFPGADGYAFLAWLGAGGAVAGTNVTPETALKASAVLACVGRIARDLATLPLHLRDASGAKVTQHPVAKLLKKPSPNHCAAVVWQTYILNLLTWGYGLASIERDRDGATPTAIVPLMSKHVACNRRGGQMIYQIAGFARARRADQVLHTPYMSLDGISGESPIRLARDVVGTTLALDEFAARFFSNGGNISSFFELPKMNPDALKETQKHIQDTYTGLRNAHKFMAIPEAKPHKVGVSPRDSQAIEARDFQTREIARIYHMPIGLIDAEKSKYAGLESQYRDYAQATLRPVAVMIEQELERKLLTEDEQDQLSIEWNLDAMVRASLKDRTESDRALVTAGIATPNEARGHHNLPPLPGGDKLLSPLNMAPADQRSRRRSKRVITPVIPDAAEPTPDPRVDALIRSIADGVATKEANAVRKAAGRTEDFPAWAQTWFEEHRAHIKSRLPVVDDAVADRIAADARDLVIRAHAENRLDAELEAWAETRPLTILRHSQAA
jgi:HK97 family phage portal protein